MTSNRNRAGDKREQAGRGPRSGPGGVRRRAAASLIAAALGVVFAAPARAQMPAPRFGEVVPRDVREMYDRGLQYLATTQGERGDWSGGGGENGPGTTGMALDGLSGQWRRPQLRPVQQPRSPRAAEHHQGPGFDDGHHGHEHVPPRLRDARPGRSLWRGRRPQSLARRQGPAVDRPGTRAGRAGGDHLAEEKPDRAPGGTRPTPTTPTRRSAAPSSSACWRRATPASKCPTRRSTRRSRSTPR